MPDVHTAFSKRFEGVGEWIGGVSRGGNGTPASALWDKPLGGSGGMAPRKILKI